MFGEEKNEKKRLDRELKILQAYENKTAFSINLIHAIQEILLAIFRVVSVIFALYLWRKNNINLEAVIALLLLIDDVIPMFSRLMLDITLIRNNVAKLSDSLKVFEAPIDAKNTTLKTLKIKNSKIEFKNVKRVFTIHNIEYQGKYSLDILSDLFGLPESAKELVEYQNCINLMKGAIECSERFSTVSPTYAEEIKSEYFAHGLQDIIRKNYFKLTGILNGIDVDFYNSLVDPVIAKNFGAETIEDKAICKREMQKMLGLPERDVPVISMITRLVSHKGIELVKSVIANVLEEDVQFVLLGTGDGEYEQFFKDLGNKYPDKTSINITFNGVLSRQIYAGSDIFLMPSISEPCGLSQMIASRYATIPVVRETGGLYDSIKPFGAGGNGFTFASTNPYDMLYVIHEAISTYKNKEVWKKLMKKAVTTDFSWLKSAEEYKNLYEQTFLMNR